MSIEAIGHAWPCALPLACGIPTQEKRESAEPARGKVLKSCGQRLFGD
jgi:hypothetical protein